MLTSEVQGDPLRFPLPTNDVGFPAHGAFRIYTLAAAVQRDFTMYLCTTPGSRTAFKLLCTKAHSRFGADRCTFEVTTFYDTPLKRWTQFGSWYDVRRSVSYGDRVRC